MPETVVAFRVIGSAAEQRRRAAQVIESRTHPGVVFAPVGAKVGRALTPAEMRALLPREEEPAVLTEAERNAVLREVGVLGGANSGSLLVQLALGNANAARAEERREDTAALVALCRAAPSLRDYLSAEDLRVLGTVDRPQLERLAAAAQGELSESSGASDYPAPPDGYSISRALRTVRNAKRDNQSEEEKR